jgi:hypothetical protein
LAREIESGPPRGHRRWRLAAVVLIAGLVLLATIALLARRWVAGALSRALETPVAIDGLWLGPRADLTLLAVRIGAQDDGGPSIARIDVDPDFRRLLRGDLVVNRIALRGVTATVEPGPDGMPSIRGLRLPSSAADGGRRIDVREVVVRDGDLIGIPPPRFRRQPLALHVDRMIARQVPTNLPGGSGFVATLEGALEKVPLTAEATAEVGGGEHRVDGAIELRGATVDGAEWPLPSAIDSLGARVSGRARYTRDTAARREDIRADLAIDELKVATRAGARLAARDVAAEGLELDLAHGWTWRAARIAIGKGTVDLERRGARARLAIERASWRDLGRDRAGTLSAAAHLESGGELRAQGTLGVDPPDADLAVEVDALSLPELTALAPELPLAIARGSASGSVRVISDRERLSVSGSLMGRQVHSAPPSPERAQDVLATDRIDVDFGFDSTRRPALRVSRLALDYPYAMIVRRAAGTFPLSSLRAVAPPEAGAAAPSPATPATPATPTAGEPAATTADGGSPLVIDELRVSNGRTDFVDETIEPPYWAGLASINGVARAIAWPEGSVDRFEFTAMHDEISPFAVDAASRPAGGFAGEASAERVSAPSLNPTSRLCSAIAPSRAPLPWRSPARCAPMRSPATPGSPSRTSPWSRPASTSSAATPECRCRSLSRSSRTMRARSSSRCRSKATHARASSASARWSRNRSGARSWRRSRRRSACSGASSATTARRSRSPSIRCRFRREAASSTRPARSGCARSDASSRHIPSCCSSPRRSSRPPTAPARRRRSSRRSPSRASPRCARRSSARAVRGRSPRSHAPSAWRAVRRRESPRAA